MDAEDNNLNQGLDKVIEARDFVNSLIDSIGTDNLQGEVEANVRKLENTHQSLIELRDDYLNEIIQGMQEAQVRQQQPPQQPQEPPVGMNLAYENVWRQLLENEKSYMHNPDYHEAHLKGFISILEQRVGNQDLFEVSYVETQTGPSHDMVFTCTVNVDSDILLNRDEEDLLTGTGQGRTKRDAERAALFDLFQQANGETMYQLYLDAKLAARDRQRN